MWDEAVGLVIVAVGPLVEAGAAECPGMSAAAVVNAVHHATGVRVRHLPVTLDEVLAGLP